jgi:hypothetical protein
MNLVQMPGANLTATTTSLPSPVPTQFHPTKPPLVTQHSAVTTVLIPTLQSELRKIGIAGQTSSPLWVLCASINVESESPLLFDKLSMRKIRVNNLDDLYHHYRDKHSDIMDKIAEAPSMDAKGGQRVLGEIMSVLVLQHSFSVPLAQSFMVYCLANDDKNAKKPLAITLLETYLRTQDAHVTAFCRNSLTGLKAKDIHLLSALDPQSLWNSPGLYRLSAATNSTYADNWSLLWSTIVKSLSFEEDDMAAIEKICTDLTDFNSDTFKSMVRGPGEHLMTSFSKIQKKLQDLTLQCGANNASDMLPSRLQTVDLYFSALVTNKDDQAKVQTYLDERARSGLGVERKDIKLQDLLEAIQWVEKKNASNPVTSLGLHAPKTELLPSNTEELPDPNPSKKDRIEIQKQELRDKGAIVFDLPYQCWHCGVVGDGARPHDARQCNQTTPCLNCGQTGHPTSICRFPKKEIFNASRARLSLPIVCAPCIQSGTNANLGGLTPTAEGEDEGEQMFIPLFNNTGLFGVL